jgi:menaquinone-9 beta-reductase
VVEKSAFPREKVCGDGLTPRAVKALHDMGIDDTQDPAFIKVNGLRVYGGRGVLDLPWPTLKDWPPYGLVRTRLDFDELLARRAQKVGVTLMERTEATAPVMNGPWVVGAMVRAAADPPAADRAKGRSRSSSRPPATRELRARFVLAADGASSRFAGQAGVRRDPTRPLGIAARRYYRMSRRQVPMLEAWLNLEDAGAVLPGYGWLFPLQDDVINLGAGLLNTFKGFKEMSARGAFEVFVRMLPEEWGVGEETAIGPLKSGPLPMGFNRRPLAQPGMLVIGDAGGVVNPFNGEGISYAMETGQMAAELVAESIAKDRPGLAHVYPTLVRERYGRYYSMGNLWVKLIGDPRFMRFATDHGLHREWLMKFALRMLANLVDTPSRDVHDRLYHALERIAPVA